ncbi:hypothetical protein ACU1JV_01195 [Paenibacillus sp. T2-29]|uniref:hypothetical protein n=1 Tax=Paenibacillus TaxID=44249 RepID=UPI0039BC2FB1
MKSNVRCNELPLNRHQLANPFMDIPMIDRLRQNESIDLHDNYTIRQVGNGYDKIEPIDSSKKFTDSTVLKSLKKGNKNIEKLWMN